MENDCYFADIILPVATKHEMNDLGNDFSSGVFQSDLSGAPLLRAHRRIPVRLRCVRQRWRRSWAPSMSGPTPAAGLTEEDRVRFFYKATGCEDTMSWEAFQKRKVFVIPCKPDRPGGARRLYNFYKDPKGNPLTTPTGLLEYSSTDIEKYMPDDPERPPVPPLGGEERDP